MHFLYIYYSKKRYFIELLTNLSRNTPVELSSTLMWSFSRHRSRSYEKIIKDRRKNYKR